jgi:Ca2+ insensitive EF hand
MILLQVEITVDSSSPAQIRDSFRELAGDKVRLRSSLSFPFMRRRDANLLTDPLSSPREQPYVTELDLQLAQVPKASVDFLTKAMPRATRPGDNGSGIALDFDGFLDIVYRSP